MKKLLTVSAIAGLSFTAANAAVLKLDGSNSIVTSTFAAAPSGTTYSVIDISAVDGTPVDSDGVVDGVLSLSASDEYVLDNITFVTDGVLKIAPGTILRGEIRSGATLNDPGALVITRSARIDAVGTSEDPIIFTTAAVDDAAPFGEPDGVSFAVFNDPSVADDAFFTKFGTQWTPGATFLDASPKTSPLAPTASFATDAPGVPPILTAVDGDEDIISYTEVVSENRSLWGGIIILGNAPTSIGRISGSVVADTTSGDLAGNILDEVFEGFIEGLDIVELGELGVYGGFNPNDSSGAMKFVSIRHGGSGIGAANEINGLTMGGVGRGTLIEFIEVYCNGDDGYEWFGGTVDTKYLISLWNNDDSFDIDEGYTGRGQFWFSLQGDDSLNGDHGGEHDGTDANHNSVDISGFGAGDSDSGLGLAPAFITVYNATYIGSGDFANGDFAPTPGTPGAAADSGANRAFRIRDGFSGIYRNSIFAEFEDEPVRGTDGDNTGFFILENNMFASVVAPFGGAISPYTAVDGSLFDVGTDAQLLASPGVWTLTDNVFDEDVFKQRRDGFFGVIPAEFDRRGLFNPTVDNDPFVAGIQNSGFDPRPDTSAFGGAPSVITDLAGYDPTFFTAVAYKGAFSPTASDDNVWTGSTLSTTNPAWSVFGTSFLQLQ